MQAKPVKFPNLRAELLRGGFTVIDLAEYIGTSRQNAYNKFNGKTALTLGDMQKVKEFFIAKGCGDFTLDYLFYTND